MDLEDLNKKSEKYNHDLYLPNNIDYLNYLLETRGLTKEIINEFQIGINEATFITIPLHDKEGNLIGFKKRFNPLIERPKDQSKYINPLGKSNLVFGYHRIKVNEPIIVITEGEFDAISLWQLGIPAITQTTGKGFPEESLIELFTTFQPERVIVAFDNDIAGQTAMYQLATKMKKYKYNLKFYNLKEYKDWNELLSNQVRDNKPLTSIKNDLLKELELSRSLRDYIIENYKSFEENYLRTYSLDQIPESEIQYLVKPYFVKNGINLITAAPKSLKSLITLHLLVSCISGEKFVGRFEVQPIEKVLLIDQENVKSEIKSRVIKLGGDPTKFLLPEESIYFDNSEDITNEILHLIEVESIDVVVIDTLRRVNFRTDENSSKDVSQFFAKIKPLTEFATVIVIHHETKATFGNTSYYRGSGDIVGAVDSHISIKKKSFTSTGSELQIIHEHSRYSGAYDPVEVAFAVEEDKFTFTYAGQTQETYIEKLRKQEQEILDKLLEFISESGELGRSTKSIEDFCKEQFALGQHKSKDLRDKLVKSNHIKAIPNFRGSKSTHFILTKLSPLQLTTI